MTERWREYVAQGVEKAGGPVPFALTQWLFLLPMLAGIRRALPGGGRVLDVGCGAGIFTALLAHHGFQVVGVDDDPAIVAYAHQMVGFFRSPAVVEQADAFDLSAFYGRFDLVYSLGVVEHFAPDATIRLLREQARCARLVLAAVPTRYTSYVAPVIDERLYRRAQFAGLMRRAGLKVREAFVYGDVPAPLARALGRWLPKSAYWALQQILTYGMGICCVGERDEG